MKKTSILSIQAGSSLRKAILLPIVMLALLFYSTTLSAQGIYNKKTTTLTPATAEGVKDQQQRAGGGDGIFVKEAEEEEVPLSDSFSLWIFAGIGYGLFTRKRLVSLRGELQK
jgi:hypothetical protein